MFAVIKTGGKQYRVSPEDVLTIERIQADAGTIVTFDSVLMLGDGADVTVGAPLVEGAAVAAEVVEQARGPKVIIFKKKRRQKYRRKNGHRQNISVVRITEILTGGAKPTVEATGEPRYPAYDAAGARTDENAGRKVGAEEPEGVDASDALADAASGESVAEAAEVFADAPETVAPETETAETAEAAAPKKAAKPKAKKAEADDAAAAEMPATEELPVLFEAPEGEPDDLKKISGVGKVIEGKLPQARRDDLRAGRRLHRRRDPARRRCAVLQGPHRARELGRSGQDARGREERLGICAPDLRSARTDFQEFSRWHIRRQAARPVTAAIRPAGASASRSSAASTSSLATSSSASAAPSGSRTSMSASARTTRSTRSSRAT